MSIAIDTSTPAPTQSLGAFGTSITSSITPPANSLVVIGISSGATTVAADNVTGVSDGTNSYTQMANAFQSNAACATIWSHYYTSAPGTITVTGTFSGSGPQQSGTLVPVVLTGAASTQNGGVATHGAGALESTSATPSVTVAATAAGSMIIAMEANFTSNVSPTPSGDQSITFNGHSSFYNGSNNGYWAQYEPTLTSGAGNVTISDTAPTGLDIAMCAVEILAATGGAATIPNLTMAPMVAN